MHSKCRGSPLQPVAARCNLMQRATACCSVLQRVAACCHMTHQFHFAVEDKGEMCAVGVLIRSAAEIRGVGRRLDLQKVD